MGKKVLLFGDIGIDDTVALIYASLNKEVEIVGIVADYGNVSREDAVSNIHYLTKVFDYPNFIPIIHGADVPLTGEQPAFYPEIHGEHGLGPIIPNDDQEFELENFFEIVKVIENYKNDLVIVNIGRLTSLATMFILYRELMNNIEEYYIMGGAFGVPGNVTTVAEANFYGDPIAVNIVLTYANNVTIIPLNATQKAIVTPGMVDYIDQFGKTKILKSLMEYYTRFYQERDPSLQGAPVHDVVTLMAVIHPEMFTFKSYPISIVLDLGSPARGQSIVENHHSNTQKSNKNKTHRIAFDLNYNVFFQHFLSVMIGQHLNGE
ncbi:nucleoside hydrolase [Psychrobacillus lasiicapitis]|uniref:Nucleoside hydrolase n=1 Tax=Psychrobacillus lasiicapitis TaxID=1636719 RepID=A0A544TH14_9BACI|nr:nucleoside hydrolase [Psychrobacillus lasiicapitis]TQR16727.1 nucleoside hydrolase [Psychrobacillus lasiicapitis]GGA27756.1 inosine-uridine preferring nucleoside hydrolase [Psychrobacillus lasiicapitis]